MRGADVIGSIGADDLAQFQQLLSAYLTETQARCVVLVDRTGRLLATAGDTGGFDQVTFASLAAADFAASDQLAELLGEEEFSSLYHHGERHSMYVADLSGWAILVTLFDRRTTLGMVRVKARGIAPRFHEAFGNLAERGPSGAVVPMEVGWADDAVSEIDRLFTE
jgi:predicted regulator of Ras-like GTPase activity (Roadblock/LC7/MglB family)